MRDVPREAHFVGHDHHRHPGSGEIAHHVEHFVDKFRVERRGRFVEQNHLRFHRECARNCHALLLAARELRWPFAEVLREMDFFQRHLCASAGRIARKPQHALRAGGDVIECAQMREQVEALKHEAEAAALSRQFGFGQRAALLRQADTLAAKADRAAVRSFQEVETAQEGGLARTRRPDQHDGLAMSNLQRDGGQDDLVAEALVQTFYGQQCCSGARMCLRGGVHRGGCGDVGDGNGGRHAGSRAHEVNIAAVAARGSATATPTPKSMRSSTGRSAGKSRTARNTSQ